MSILGIGQQSKYHQATAGSRRYVNPFLLPQQKFEISLKKQHTQLAYRQILLQQMKQKQKQKQRLKKKHLQQDLKHQRQFYAHLQKIQKKNQMQEIINKQKNKEANNSQVRVNKYQDHNHNGNHFYGFLNNENQNNYHNSHSHNKYSNYHTQNQNQSPYSNNDKKLSYQTNPSSYINSPVMNNQRKYLYSSQHKNPQSNHYLVNNSLIDIGRRIRSRKNSNSSFADYGNLSLLRNINQKNYLSLNENRHEQIKYHLNQKVGEVYDLMKNSRKVMEGNQRKIKKLKKRLKTQPMFVLEQIDDQQPMIYNNFSSIYNFGTNLSPKLELQNTYERQDHFYKVPSFRNHLSIQNNEQENQTYIDNGQNPQQPIYQQNQSQFSK